MADNLILGRGKVYFDQFLPSTTTKTGERYFGNTPAFGLNVTTQSIKHYNSDAGVKVQDRETVLQTEFAGTLTTDNMDAANTSLFFFGTADTLSTVLTAAQTDTIIGVRKDRYYQVGVTAVRPQGVRKISSVVVKVSGAAKTIGTDYTVDLETARVYIVPGGTIADAATITVEYTIDASTRERIVSGTNPIEGALRFISDNPEGTDRDAYLPWVKLTPNGDFALKGDEYLQMQFQMAVQKLDTFAHVYLDGRPY